MQCGQLPSSIREQTYGYVRHHVASTVDAQPAADPPALAGLGARRPPRSHRADGAARHRAAARSWATGSSRRPGVAGGYRLEAGSAVPPLLLTDDEAVAMAIGLRIAAAQRLVGRPRHHPHRAGQARAGAPVGPAAAGECARRCHPAGRDPHRRCGLPGGARASWRWPAATTSGCGSATPPPTGSRPGDASSRTPSRRPTGTGTWSAGTSTGRTGAPSASTGSATSSTPGRGSSRGRSPRRRSRNRCTQPAPSASGPARSTP